MDELTARIEAADDAIAALRVERLVAHEAISRLTRLSLAALSDAHEPPDVEDLVGVELGVVLARGGDERRRFVGTVTMARRGETTRLASAGGGDGAQVLTRFELELEPAAHALGLVTTQELFLDTDVPSLVREKLGNVGLREGDDFELRLGSAYPSRELVVQYRESDLAFVSRLTEHVGISFFFEPQAGGAERLVLTDTVSGFSAGELDTEALAVRAGGEHRELFDLFERARAVSRVYAMQDHNYRTPLVDVIAQHELEGGLGGGVIEYGSHAKSPEEAAALARLRAEAAEATRLVYEARSTRLDLFAGARRKVLDHPRLEGRELLLVEVRHVASFAQGVAGGPSGGTSYECELTMVPTTSTYRPPLRTPRPRVHGFLTGIVQPDEGGDGAVGARARLDEQGRYYVAFHFDTATAERPRASKPVRMAQQHVGNGFGTHFPLRPGVEVIVAFADGDPDRPVIVGAVPNPTAPSVVDASSADRARIKTQSGALIEFGDK
jgi:type VI secretion system secreted protein VgrG